MRFLIQTINADNGAIIHSWCYTKSRLDGVGASQAFFWYDNDKNIKTCFCMTQFIYILEAVDFCTEFPGILGRMHGHKPNKDKVQYQCHSIASQNDTWNNQHKNILEILSCPGWTYNLCKSFLYC